jgi:predicted permease
MKFLDSLRFRFAAVFRRSELNVEMDEELRSHVQLRADDLEQSGMPRFEAERLARIEFGGRERFKEECREAAGGILLESMVQDAIFSLRVLRKSPGFTLAAILTLALAIGANAVVFSVMNAFILRPLNVPEPESLYAIFRHGDAHQSYPDYVDLRDRNRSFDELAAYNIDLAGFDTGANPSVSWLYDVSENYFDALRLQPYLGRFFHASDEHGPNSAPYVVLSYAYWHSHFQEDRGVVGRVVQVDKHPFTIVGVAPPDFHGTLLFFHPDFFVPLVNSPQINGMDLNARGARGLFMLIGHLKAGVTPAQAAADLNSVGAYLEKTYPKDDGNMKFELNRPGLYGDFIGRPAREFLTGLMLLAGLILLAACANLGSLNAARAADRSKEVALRLALGSSRVRILRRLFTEAVLVSLAGGALGLWASMMLLQALSVWQPFPTYPLHLSVTPDTHVYALALLLSLASGFLFGAVPIKQVLHTDPYQVIKFGSTASVGKGMRVRDMLLVAQIAICAVLVTSSMVALRGLMRSLHDNFGFDINTTVVSTDLALAGYKTDQVPATQKRMIAALAAIPGVESVGLSNAIPLGMGTPNSMVFTDQTIDLRSANAAAEVDTFRVSPEYFRAAGTTLRSGRSFTWNEDKAAPPVAVINQQFANKIFGSVPKAVGAYFKLQDGTRVQVVGVAEQGKYDSLTEAPQPVIFLPILQSPSTQSMLTVRSSRNSGQLAPAIRSSLRQIDSAIPFSIDKRAESLDFVLFGPRMATISLGVMGAMGAMLAITGIFGMAAYSVSKRLKELGIRIAIGAQPREVLQAALGRAVKLLAIGSAAGLLLGILASRLLALIVDQATPRDPLTLCGVVLAMVLLGLIATWIPAQRALSVDPIALLREE